MSVPGVRRWWALAAIVLCALTIGFDATILNVALPTLAAKIGATNSDLQWIVDSYILIFAGLLLPAGVLADRYGRKKALLTGLVLFAGASAVAMSASGPTGLIVARALMGIGAATITPVSLAVIPSIFEPAERARAVGVTTVGLGLGVPLGPLVGGYLINHFWWGSVFAVNIPTAAVAFVAVALLVPESRDPAPGRLDLAGAALVTAGLVSTVYGIIAGPDRGWGDGAVLATLCAGLLLLAAFVAWQRRNPEPMIDLGLFRDRQFLWAALAATVASFAMFGLLFVLPQYLQVVAGHDAFGTGLRLIPMMLGLVVGARVSEGTARRWGARGAIAAGLTVIAAGLATGAFTTVHSGYATVATWLAVVGVGVGLSMAPAMTAVLEVLPAARTGMGSSLSQTLRQVGGALGVAVLGSVLASAYTSALRLPPALPPVAVRTARDSVAAAQAVAAHLGAPGVYDAARLAYLRAMDLVLLICAVAALLGALLVARFLPATAGRGTTAPADLPTGAAGGRESDHEPARTA
jgi:EmrB/QacA subfamily drug resistance transporter